MKLKPSKPWQEDQGKKIKNLKKNDQVKKQHKNLKLRIKLRINKILTKKLRIKIKNPNNRD
jgi:hypothetical protein